MPSAPIEERGPELEHFEQWNWSVFPLETSCHAGTHPSLVAPPHPITCPFHFRHPARPFARLFSRCNITHLYPLPDSASSDLQPARPLLDANALHYRGACSIPDAPSQGTYDSTYR